MFYFADSDPLTEAIAAVYSGRFAFIAGARERTIHTYMDANRNCPSPLAEPAQVAEAFLEENSHQTVIRACKTGLEITGLRLLIRLLWAAADNQIQC